MSKSTNSVLAASLAAALIRIGTHDADAQRLPEPSPGHRQTELDSLQAKIDSLQEELDRKRGTKQVPPDQEEKTTLKVGMDHMPYHSNSHSRSALGFEFSHAFTDYLRSVTDLELITGKGKDRGLRSVVFSGGIRWLPGNIAEVTLSGDLYFGIENYNLPKPVREAYTDSTGKSLANLTARGGPGFAIKLPTKKVKLRTEYRMMSDLNGVLNFEGSLDLKNPVFDKLFFTYENSAFEFRKAERDTDLLKPPYDVDKWRVGAKKNVFDHDVSAYYGKTKGPWDRAKASRTFGAKIDLIRGSEGQYRK